LLHAVRLCAEYIAATRGCWGRCEARDLITPTTARLLEGMVAAVAAEMGVFFSIATPAEELLKFQVNALPVCSLRHVPLAHLSAGNRYVPLCGILLQPHSARFFNTTVRLYIGRAVGLMFFILKLLTSCFCKISDFVFSGAALLQGRVWAAHLGPHRVLGRSVYPFFYYSWASVPV